MSSQNHPEKTDTASNRRMILLTDGYSDPVTAKTACSILRYRSSEVDAVLDQEAAGRTASDLFGVGETIPVVASIADAPSAKTLVIGIAPPGGKIPDPWRAIVLEALSRGLNVVSGLHEFLSNDPEFVSAAEQSGAEIIDVRRNSERDVANRENIRPECLRVLTVGHDCCVGKMVVAIELARGLSREDQTTKFVATGQTGILIEGDGCPVDCVVADFVSGAVEKLVLKNQHHDILLVEGQGSLAHPRYSAVTLGLLHGCLPQGMILCYEAGRTVVNGMPQIPLKSLPELRSVYETTAGLMWPSKVVGVAINSRLLSDSEADKERDRVRNELGLPACDVLRHGPGELIMAVESLRNEQIG
ncbi:MAG: DUF1611 domain-containing protein [Planctomycetota bacterium]